MSSPQHPEPDGTQFPSSLAAPVKAPLSNLSTAATNQSSSWRQTVTQFLDSLTKLPDNIVMIWNEYKPILTSVALVLAAIITLKIVLAVMNALNGIPLLEQTFQLVGISYSAWFVWRYLLTKSSRQEVFQIIQGFLNK
jgi:hypothetical protein